MKKLLPFLFIASLLFISCGEKNKKQTITQTSQSARTEASIASTNRTGIATFQELTSFFEPSFNSILPEDNDAVTAVKVQASGKHSKEKSESVIPGLRKLTDYLTAYNTEKGHFYKSSSKNENISDDSSAETFYVEDWGPQMIVSESENPNLYVIFSQPVHKLSALEAASETSDIMKITPPLKGVFRWYGTKHLAFEASEPADPSEEYTIEINKKLKSLSKAQITGETIFTTKAQDVEIIRLFGGYLKDSTYYSNWNTGTIPPYDKKFYIRLNYPITLNRFNELIKVYINGEPYTYNAQLDFNEEAFSWSSPVKYDKLKGKSNSFIVTIDGTIPFGTSVKVQVNGSNSSESYDTLKPFYISEVHSYTSYSENNRLNPLEVRFSQKPDLKSLIENTSFDFDFKLSENNVAVEGYTAKFFNLPVSKKETHTISFKNGVKDIYGQDIDFRVRRYGRSTSEQKSSFTFTVSSPAAYSRFQNYGTKIMEAQYPHKIVFEYQNINPGSAYYLESTTKPLDTSSLKKMGAEAFPIDPKEKDQRQFEEIDLNPYLKNGYGAIKFEANINRDRYNSWEDKIEETTDENLQTIQVTDLGVTARIGVNKAVVYVTSMKTGKPVPDASVEIYEQLSYRDGDISAKPFADGKTDKTGLCIIKFTEEEFNTFNKSFDNLYREAPVVKVIKDNDKVIFQPGSHDPYVGGIWPASYENAVSVKQRTFMFVDRGLYKPGETVSFRGIDRNQNLGMILTNHGEYKITVTNGDWNGTEIVPGITGQLSESGGFYGSFKLPDDIEPGTYQIKFKRANAKGDNDYESIYFTVAEFERLKIAATVTVPEVTYYGGDKISAELFSEYLAGGALSGAEYSVSWFKQPATFAPSTAETKDYSFGPVNVYGSRTFYQQSKGNLSNDGTASLACNAEKITDGNPYTYRVEAAVTDISNQRVSAISSILVNPAEFYVGLKRKGNGFAQKGKKLDIDYALVNPDGTLLSSLSKAEDLKYTLTRRVWTMIHEQSVDETVYTRYEASDKEEGSGSVKISATGTFEITPPEAGWYTLKVTGTDRSKNYVETAIQFYASGSGAAWRGSDNSQSITLTPSQSQYNPGDKAELLMESPLPAGDYLITVEREGIFTEEIRHFDSPANVIEIPVSANYVPVVYVSVASFSVRNGEPTHQYGEPDLDKPKGYYGVTSLFVNPMVRAFSVSIECDKPVYKPGEQATITLTATKGGKPYPDAELTLMAVDRGVLDLINYHVPNPIDYFYNPYYFPLSVFGGDSRALLMDPVTYSVKNLQGGDAENADEEKEDERKDFRPTAVFEPVLITDKNGQVKCTFTMPDNLTTYRITAFGVKDDLFALQEDEVKVQNPMNVQIVKPRELRVRDTAEFGVVITNLDKDSQKVNVKVSVKPLTQEMADSIGYVLDEGMSVVPGSAFIDGGSEHTVTVASGDSSVVYFDLGADGEGVVQLTLQIESPILKEKIIETLEISKTYTYETVTMIGTVGADDKKSEEEFVIPDFAKDGQGSLKFTLDATRLGMLGTGVNYLFRYPYGCLEQQSSRILPLIIFENYIDVFGLDSEVNNPSKLVKSYFKQWAKIQHNDGGFPYWKDSPNSSFYVSLRIAHICAVAKQHGYKDSEIKVDVAELTRYISRSLSSKSYFSKYEKAYAAYVLSMIEDNAATTAANRLLEELYADKNKETLNNLSYMGIAYNNLGNSEKANEIAALVRQYVQISERSVSILKKYTRNIWDCFESETEQLSTMLQLLVTLNPDDHMVDKLIFTLMQKQSQGYWTNTAATAHVLEGIYTYIKQRKLDSTKYQASVEIDGVNVMTEKFEDVNAKPKTLSLGFTDDQLKALARDKAIPVTFEKNGTGQLYYTMEMKYALPDEMLTARNEGIKLTYEIVDAETKEIVNKADDTSSLVKLESGKLYKATVKLESTRDRTYVALRAPVPSGAEILDSTFVTSGTEAEIVSTGDWRHWISNKVVYNNEIQFFWDNFGTGSTSVTFTFRASRRGVYPTPPVLAECMYEPEIFGRGDGYLFTVE